MKIKVELIMWVLECTRDGREARLSGGTERRKPEGDTDNYRYDPKHFAKGCALKNYKISDQIKRVSAEVGIPKLISALANVGLRPKSIAMMDAVIMGGMANSKTVTSNNSPDFPRSKKMSQTLSGARINL